MLARPKGGASGPKKRKKERKKKRNSSNTRCPTRTSANCGAADVCAVVTPTSRRRSIAGAEPIIIGGPWGAVCKSKGSAQVKSRRPRSNFVHSVQIFLTQVTVDLGQCVLTQVQNDRLRSKEINPEHIVCPQFKGKWTKSQLTQINAL